MFKIERTDNHVFIIELDDLGQINTEACIIISDIPELIKQLQEIEKVNT